MNNGKFFTLQNFHGFVIKRHSFPLPLYSAGTPPTGSSMGTASLNPAFPRRNNFFTILVSAAPRCGQQSIVDASRSVVRGKFPL